MSLLFDFFKVFVTALVAIGRTREAKTAISALLCHNPSICWCRELTGLIDRVEHLRGEARQHMVDNNPVAAETLLTEAIVAFLQASSFCYTVHGIWHSFHSVDLVSCALLPTLDSIQTITHTYIYSDVVMNGAVFSNNVLMLTLFKNVCPCNDTG